MGARAVGANLLWTGAAARAWWRFRSALRDPLRPQHERLLGYLRENRDTAAGRQFGFAEILRRAHASGRRHAPDLVEEYRRRVPVSGYDDLEPLIDRVARGEPGVLTAQPVRRLVPSSGSTSAAKLIPYTARLQQELSRAVDAWIADLFRTRPALIAGQAYWSVTPLAPEGSAEALRSRQPRKPASATHEACVAQAFMPATPDAECAGAGIPASGVTEAFRPATFSARIPIGFDDDSAYLGGARQAIARMILAVPDAVRFIESPEAFRYVTLLFLLRAPDLRLISVWHPSFLERLLDALPARLDAIIRDLERGTLTPPSGISQRAGAVLARGVRPDRHRAAQLRRLTGLSASELWPRLTLVSCWADGAAATHAAALARRLGNVPVQAKGLLATEGIVTIPFAGRHPVAILSHFFEFVGDDGGARLAHELVTGGEYGVVITTGGGLYRYRLGDRVRVEGWVGGTPSLGFVGREDRVSDRFGEKISDGFVAGVLRRLYERRPAPGFAMLAPEETRSGVAYTLFVERGREPPDPAALERELRRNPHYAWCVDLGQLRPARVVPVARGADRAYVDACVARGQRLGDVKPVALHCDSGWERVLTSVQDGGS